MKRFCLFAFVCCYFVSAPVQAEKLSVVASFSILADMVHQIAGDRVTLTTLVGPDGDAHVYEPTPAAAKAVARANLVIINGLGFEGWMSRLLEASGYKGPVVIASSDIHPLKLAPGVTDPHAWQNIDNGKAYVSTIRDALIQSDPPNAVFYNENAAHYLLQLDELQQWVEHAIASVPMQKRRAITSHDALSYFGKRYGITFIAPLGYSTEGDVSAATMARIIDQIRGQQVKAVFLENMTDPRLIRELVEDGGAVIGGTLYSDALSQPLGEAPTYIEMFRHNVTVMVQAMQAQ